MGRYKKINSTLPNEGLSGSKPPVMPANPNMNIDANKNAASINTEGIGQTGSGTIYMTHSFVSSVESTIVTGDRVDSITVTTDDRCCEGTSLISAVDFTESETVTSVNISAGKGEVFLPVLFIDTLGKIREVVMNETSQESSYGTEWALEPPIEGEIPMQ